jgi:large subunit ribosomal protein L5
MARLKERYQKEVAPAIAKEFGIKNSMAIPRLSKIVVNMGMGEAISNAKVLDTAVEELKSIAGQKRDFRGVSPKAFDGRGNYTIGIREQLIFPEIDFNKVDKLRGMNISIVTTARDDDQARALLKALGMPFRT